ncbi:hypothetical protein FEM48_Zijuj02G0049600 [Ziziphus jujuba var. spinosa]|uniref:Uncharacterized protein n=1 Tax=Ziziphus jujuba var. spinosa TaxID=714518 RepID=A0A978VTR9_ZIZJJ|nr:hypothetical protein FEM48_Zijuj02G0049600 [Ziziphus jujuba var. spinosa]
MDKFTPTPFKISTDELFDKFLEENKHKIPGDVRVERVSKKFADDHSGVMIHAYTLSLGVVKPQDRKVNQVDLQKALSYENRDWRYLLDPDNWGTVAVEKAVASEEQSRCKQLIQDCGEAHSGGLIKEMTTPINIKSIRLLKKQKLNINHSHSTTGSVNNHGFQEEGSTQDVVRNPSRFLHSAQEAAAAAQTFHSGQNLPNSHASMPIAPSLPPHLLGDNDPQAGTRIDFNFNCMDLLHSLFLGKDIDDHQGSEKHLSDPFLKAIQSLEHKPFEEVCVEAARSVGKVGILIVYLMNRIKCQNATIKDLQATIERLNKELEESQLDVGKEALRFENPRATQKESVLDFKKELRNMEKSFQLQIESLKKDNAEIMGRLTQFGEMNSRQQNQPHCSPFWPMSAASEQDMVDCLAMLREHSFSNPNQISKNGIEIGCPSRVNTNRNLPGDDGLGLTVEANHGSRQSGHERTKLQ